MGSKKSGIIFGLAAGICLILGAFSAAVLFVQPKVLAECSFIQTYFANGIGGTTGHGIGFMAGTAVFFGAILFGGFFFHEKVSPGLIAASVLFGIIEPAALLMEDMQDLFPWLLKPHFRTWFLAAFLCASLLLYAFGTVLLKGLTRLSRTRRDSDTFWDRHIGLLSLLILFSVFFVWILVFYPGSMCFDMCYQLLEYYGAEELTTHHPVFSTLIMGGLMDVGRALFGDDNAGLFLYVLFQGLFLSFAYSRAVVFVNRRRFHRVAELLTLLFFAAVPAFGALSQYATKDPVSYGWMVLLTLSFMRVYETADKGRQLQARDAVSLTLSALFGCLYRKEVVLIALICFAAVLFLP